MVEVANHGGAFKITLELQSEGIFFPIATHTTMLRFTLIQVLSLLAINIPILKNLGKAPIILPLNSRQIYFNYDRL